MAQIKVDTIDADKQKAVVSVEAAAADKQAAAADELKVSCEADLAEAMPALEAAMKALDTLNKNDITMVKSMKTPPAGVVLVMKVRFHIIRDARIENVGKYQSCMVSK